MQLTIGASFAFFSCLYLLTFTSPASAKCTGKWAIHACYGGNGKRSDPNMSPESNIEPSLLHRVLISDPEELSRVFQKETFAQPEGRVLSPLQREEDDQEGAEERYRRTLSRFTPEVRDLRRFLRTLTLQHAFRENEDMF